MKAAVYDRLGPAEEVLRVAEMEAPVPRAGEVRVRVRVSAVNPTDTKARSAGPGKRMPFARVVPHHDGAGEIDAVGPWVDKKRVGERVWIYFAALNRPYGTAAEWVCVPEEQAVRLPDEVDFTLGACLGIPAITAHRALFQDGPIAGSTVLVAGGAGAVGHFAIELARWAGASVIATVSTPEKAALALAAGAHWVVNYKDPDAAEQIRAACPGGVNRVIEVALRANFQLDQEVLAPGGTVVVYAADGADPELPVRPLMYQNATLRFLLIYGADRKALGEAIVDLSCALAYGGVTAQPEHRFELAGVAYAHEAVEAGVTGKVLVELPG